MSKEIIIEQRKVPTNRWRYFLVLMRPPNLVTATTDVLCGIAISGIIYSNGLFSLPAFKGANPEEIIHLLLSTVCLYGGGVVFNDVFDFSIDKIERPERPIPSGKVSIIEATLLGGTLLVTGIILAILVNVIAGLIAFIITLLALLYDFKSKHHKIAGPVNMGLCRAFNQCLGISIVTDSLMSGWYYSLIPLLYIIAITLISHGEVKGGNSISLRIALIIYLFLIVSVVVSAWQSLPYALLWCVMILPPLIKALQTGDALHQRKAVKAGVLSVIIMDASIAAGFAGVYYSFFIILLLPLSIFIAKKFSVT